MFISFEGMDGSGKTTQIQLTADYLQANGYDVLTVREPGGTDIGDRIRSILLDHKQGEHDLIPRAELLLFCASRAQLVEQVILPHLQAGGVVLCDRFIDSTYAYQGYGHGLNLKTLKQIISFATHGLLPDLTFYLEIAPHEGITRRAQGTQKGQEWNRLDAMAMSFHERVYKGYRDLVLAEPARFVEIQASEDIHTIQMNIRHNLAEWLQLPF
jgi:dTMP kinase